MRVYREGLRRAVAYADSKPDLFPQAKLAEGRLLTRESKEDAWSLWKSFLDYVLALDALGRHHRRFYRLQGAEREDAFLAGYAAFLAQYRFLHVGRAAEFAALEGVYKAMGGIRAPELRAAIGEDADVLWRLGAGKGEALTAKNALRVVKRAGFTAWFPVQAGVSEWMGDTKAVRRGRSLVTQAQIQALTARLEPGDILLERREWYLSNVGLPGFWPHGALYIGTAAERRRFFDDPGVQAWARGEGAADGSLETLLASRSPKTYAAAAAAQERGHLPRVIEAISEGVSLTTIEHSADADSGAVLRPRLSKAARAAAILRAFHVVGRPYDFNFDFVTDSELVCTELVVKAYEPRGAAEGLAFPVEDLMGRKVTPANLIARSFAQASGTPGQQLDLVVFLDGHERSGRAVEADLGAFLESWKRPKWHILVQDFQKTPEGPPGR